MGFYFNLEAVLIDYLEFIYDKRENDGVSCTIVMLQTHFRLKSGDVAQQIAPAFKKGLMELKRSMYYVLTREGEKYVENYRYGKTNDRDN